MPRQSSRATKQTHAGMALHAVEVAAVRDVTPSLRRVTLAAPTLRAFADDGPDQRLKLLLPRAGQPSPLLPVPVGEGTGWYDAWLAMAPAVRPVLRTYTVRAARPEAGELDLDLVRHAESHAVPGPGARWVERVREGDRVAVHAAWGEYETDHRSPVLVAGDHCALPAVAAICERLPPGTRGRVVLAVPEADRLDLPLPPDVRLDWVEPGGLVAAVEQGAWEGAGEAPGYAWVTGEQREAAAMRRHLVRTCGLPPSRVMFMGYWRRGAAIDGPEGSGEGD